MINQDLKDLLKKIPAQPGVYLMQSSGRVIYVGKAKSLTSRVNSYFVKHAVHSAKNIKMLSLVDNIDYIITSTEIEALILENTLIKKHSPKYNILLRDDKTYPFLRLTLEDDFPRLVITRRVSRKNGSKYFGPYSSAGSLRETFKVLNRYFQLATCKIKIDGKAKRTCLQHQIKRCAGVCAGMQSKEDYIKNVNMLIMFLEGRSKKLLSYMKMRMENQSENLLFEAAAGTRDSINSIKAVIEKQRVVSMRNEDKDVIGMEIQGDTAYLDILFIRSGTLSDKTEFRLTINSSEELPEETEILSSCLKQFYSKNLILPPVIVIPSKINDKELIEQWLSKKQGSQVTISVPRQGDNLHLLKIATQNVKASMKKFLKEDEENLIELKRLQKILGTKNLPKRIEVFDISNISGDMAVGSMIVLENNKFNKKAYKRFKIKTIQQSDDFGMMREVISRYYNKYELPDLIVVDGGKGQLSSALDALGMVCAKEQLATLDIIGLAKEKEEKFERVYKPNKGTPITLERGDRSTFLLQRIRDEAHRFAITYHRKLREKKIHKSKLDEVMGVGPKRKKRLLTKFGSVKRIMGATPEEISTVPGMTIKLAHHILDSLHEKE